MAARGGVPGSLPPLRDQIGGLTPSQIVELWEMGQGRNDVIALWVGEGDLPTPGFIIDRAMRL